MVVVDGASSLDESMLSGPVPVEKTVGARVAGATINGTGALTMLAEKVGETLLARIVALVADAQRSRAGAATRGPRRRGIRSAVIAVAVVTFVVWANVGPDPRLPHAPWRPWR
jgi:Cu+-exporting ATPase